MRKLVLGVLAAVALPGVAAAASWEKVSLVDAACAEKVKGKADGHPTACLLRCADSGYGVVTADGTWVKLDQAGNQLALDELKKTKKKDHIRVNVTGEKSGDVIQVASLKIAD